MARFEFGIGTGYVGSEIKEEYIIPDEELEGETEEEREKIINAHYEEWVWCVTEASRYWKEIEEEE